MGHRDLERLRSKVEEGRRRMARKEKTGEPKKSAFRELPEGWVPSKRSLERRRRQATEAGYSEREIDIILEDPHILMPSRWKSLRYTRYQEVEEFCKEERFRVPSRENWEAYWKSPKDSSSYKGAKEIIDDWKEASKRIDIMKGNLTIWDIIEDT